MVCLLLIYALCLKDLKEGKHLRGGFVNKIFASKTTNKDKANINKYKEEEKRTKRNQKKRKWLE